MMNARMTLDLPCGCKFTLYEGDVVGIPFGKLPTSVGEAISSMEQRGCRCPAIYARR